MPGVSAKTIAAAADDAGRVPGFAETIAADAHDDDRAPGCQPGAWVGFWLEPLKLMLMMLAGCRGFG